jgi:myo-inositol 2-dehydrogenase/D-chiro-inositol 1-dehydrogenase
MRLYDETGRSAGTARSDTELMIDAYTGEFAEFASAIQEGRRPSVGGDDAWAAFAIAQACIESIRTGNRTPVTQGRTQGSRS